MHASYLHGFSHVSLTIVLLFRRAGNDDAHRLQRHLLHSSHQRPGSVASCFSTLLQSSLLACSLAGVAEEQMERERARVRALDLQSSPPAAAPVSKLACLVCLAAFCLPTDTLALLRLALHRERPRGEPAVQHPPQRQRLLAAAKRRRLAARTRSSWWARRRRTRSRCGTSTGWTPILSTRPSASRAYLLLILLCTAVPRRQFGCLCACSTDDSLRGVIRSFVALSTLASHSAVEEVVIRGRLQRANLRGCVVPVAPSCCSAV